MSEAGRYASEHGGVRRHERQPNCFASEDVGDLAQLSSFSDEPAAVQEV